MTTIESPIETMSPMVPFSEEQINAALQTSPQELVSPERTSQLNEALLKVSIKGLECAGLPVDSRWNYMIVSPIQRGEYREKIVIDRNDDSSYEIDYTRENIDSIRGSVTNVEVSADGIATAVHSSFTGEHTTFGDEPVKHLLKKLGNISCGEVEVLFAGHAVSSAV